jgi:glycosyltransferase involved in cell wall biosynthesis
VSNRKRHKNEFRLIEAFSISGLSSEIRLVFTGGSTAELSEFIERKRVTPQVFFAGFVREEKLPALYRGAAALVFPSLYEGFGLPVLEAMACGTPVVTSNVTALPEVAGDAALLVDPTSVEQIAGAMRQIASDTALRRQLRDKGLSQAARFSWANTTAGVQQLMGTLIQDKPQ